MIIEPDLYTIMRGSSEDLNAFLNSDKIELGGYATSFVSSDDFKTSNSDEIINIRLVGFDKDLLISEIISEIEKGGYKLPEA